MNITQLDHLVLTVKDIQASCDFYAAVLGMEVVTFGNNRKALRFGEQKINLHQAGQEFEPKAAAPTPGSADLCFLTETPLDDIIMHLGDYDIMVLEGPEVVFTQAGHIKDDLVSTNRPRKKPHFFLLLLQ